MKQCCKDRELKNFALLIAGLRPSACTCTITDKPKLKIVKEKQ